MVSFTFRASAEFQLVDKHVWFRKDTFSALEFIVAAATLICKFDKEVGTDDVNCRMSIG